MAAVIMAKLSARGAKVRLIFLKHVLKKKGRLSLNVIREVCFYLHNFSEDLTQVTATFLRFFPSGPQVPLSTPIQVDEYSSWIVLENGLVFCSGGFLEGGKALKTAYLLGRNGTVDQLPCMLTARYHHGLIQLQHLYVFGGCKFYVVSTIHTDYSNKQVTGGRNYAGYLKDCEMLDLTTRMWKHLPDMVEGRSGFNPCLFNRWVYVCGWGSKLLEVFSPNTESFLPFQLTLPETDSGCTLYVRNQLLVVHSGNYIVKFRAKQKGTIVQQSQAKYKSYKEKWSNTQPVLDPNHRYFFIFQYDRCLCLTTSKGRVVN